MLSKPGFFKFLIFNYKHLCQSISVILHQDEGSQLISEYIALIVNNASHLWVLHITYQASEILQFSAHTVTQYVFLKVNIYNLGGHYHVDTSSIANGTKEKGQHEAFKSPHKVALNDCKVCLCNCTDSTPHYQTSFTI